MRQLGTEYSKYVPQTIYGPPAGTALTVFGPANVTDDAVLISSGTITATGQMVPTLHLRPTAGTGGFGGSGVGILFDIRPNGPTGPGAYIASRLENGGGGGPTDFAGGLAFAYRAIGDSAPMPRVFMGTGNSSILVNSPPAYTGVTVTAGSSAADYCANFINQANTQFFLRIFGDGGLVIGNPTGGSMGYGTINVNGGIFVNGQVLTVP